MRAYRMDAIQRAGGDVFMQHKGSVLPLSSKLSRLESKIFVSNALRNMAE